MAWNEWQEHTESPVQVVRRSGGRFTSDTFPNLAAAQAAHPEIDPIRCTAGFTWATRGTIDGKPAIRFESWEAERILSAD